jgi:uncharacterized protein YdcH (DUF465 family)
MEKRDLELIEKYSTTDSVLSNLYREHITYEEKLEELENKTYLTPEEEYEKTSLKKKKLLGRDKMEAILRKYRAAQEK